MPKSLPNILFIILDTARADALSCYGCPHPTTPNIDRLAEKSYLFKQAFSTSPWTLPSHVSFLTGKKVSQHQITQDSVWDTKRERMVQSRLNLGQTLPMILKNQGYTTAGFSNNPWIASAFGFNAGFDYFFESFEMVGLLQKIKKCVRKLIPIHMHPLLDGLNAKFRINNSDSGASSTLNTFYEWLSKPNDNKPKFMFFNFIEPHLPYVPPKPYNIGFVSSYIRRKPRGVNQDFFKFLTGRITMDQEDFFILRGLYEGEVCYLDSKLGELFDVLRSNKLWDNTAVIIASDHGENIGEDGLMDHQLSVKNTLLRVPLIMKLPGQNQGKTIEKFVSLKDVFYSIKDIVGVGDTDKTNGTSLLDSDYPAVILSQYEKPVLTVGSIKKRFRDFDPTPFLSEYECVFYRDYKLIVRDAEPWRLYHIRSDPDEINDIKGVKSDVARDMAILGDAQNNKNKVSIKTTAAKRDGQNDKDVEDKLRALGYL